MDCPTCHQLAELVANTSGDWAFAEQLVEVSRNNHEMAEAARRKAESARREYDLALQTLTEHQRQCTVFQSGASASATGVS